MIFSVAMIFLLPTPAGFSALHSIALILGYYLVYCLFLQMFRNIFLYKSGIFFW